jgi:lipoprotein-anchoring transpeptidase ErfK/SrfK
MRGSSGHDGRGRWAHHLARLAACVLTLSVIGVASARAELASAMRLGLLARVSSSEATTLPPASQIVAKVDLSAQKMELFVDDALVNIFPVSSGRMGYNTPPGEYHAQFIAAHWRSRKYNFAPMPWSVFFHGGYAIHGTTEVSRLGQPASHGCIRLHPDNAKIFYALVLKNGRENTTITITR